ncbi:hypothetical protein AB0L97_09790 [Nocardia sp. NPDC051911]|uniref:hypothetical protein n=1 Tax=Nocardia sp. NPDC051911 TaxID=3154648 RepID=UPI003446020A
MTVAVVAAALTAGCATSPSPSPPSPEQPAAVTQGALCDSLLTFFGNQLGAVDLTAVPLFNREETISPGGICTVINSTSQRANGRVSLRNAPNAPDPTEGVVGFRKTTGLNDPVWVQDMRTDTRNPGIEVVLATRIGEWNGQFRITESETRTATGILHLTDEDINRAAYFLVELTRKVSKA